LIDAPEAIEAHRQFLTGCCRVDIFGLKEEGSVDGRLHAPLRPELPTLVPGKTYLLETVIRTLTLGHHLTQGTTDSNELWLDVTVTSGDRVIGRSGGIDELGQVDPWSHFVNVFLLDENGRRIDRRNPQDIRVPLYNNQIPPGAGQTVHYELTLPEDVDDHVTIDVRFQYRKFDATYMQFVASRRKAGDAPLRGATPGQTYVNALPVVTIASDRVTLPVAGVDKRFPDQSPPDFPAWQRWNDYGIGLLLKGKAELKQAAEAFTQVEALGRYDGPLNLARVLFTEGRLDEAVAAINRAAAHDDPPAPPWTLAWLSGVVNRQQGNFDEAIGNFRRVVDGDSAERRARGFDFSKDYIVLNDLGAALFDKAKQQRGAARRAQREELLREAVAVFERTLAIDSEDVTAHYNLALLHQELGETAEAAEHRRLHTRYSRRYPAANHAAEPLVIYSLHRDAEHAD
jgi:Tfp pilus assembly protein PilF